jgi:hypothetical protein
VRELVSKLVALQQQVLIVQQVQQQLALAQKQQVPKLVALLVQLVQQQLAQAQKLFVQL